MKKSKFGVGMGIAALGLAAVLRVAPEAHAQPMSGSWLTNATLTLTTSNLVTVNSAPQYVRKGQGMAILPYFAGTNAGTANIEFVFAVSADGTNYSTTSDFKLAVPMNGTTAVIGYTNWPSLYLDNVRYVRLKSLYNYHSASVFVTNLWYSYWP